jgi:hypothetical protein
MLDVVTPRFTGAGTLVDPLPALTNVALSAVVEGRD